MEDKVDTSTAEALCSDIFHEATLQLLAILFQEPTDKIKDDRSHVVLVNGMVLRVVVQELTLLLLDSDRDLL